MEKSELEQEVSRLRDELATVTMQRNQARDLAESLRGVNLTLSADLTRTTADIAEVNARIGRILAQVRGH